MKLKHLYLLLALIGSVVPYYFFVIFLVQHGLDVTAFRQQLLGTPISTSFAADLLLSGLVFVVFLSREAKHYTIDHWWIYVVVLLVAGLSVALPLFLYVRECRLERIVRRAGASPAPQT